MVHRVSAVSLPTLAAQIILKQTQTSYFTRKYVSMHLQKMDT